MKNIHILPTDKPSRLSIYDNTLSFLKFEKFYKKLFEKGVQQPQNILITSDEEIKEENLTKEIYVIDTQTNNIGKLTCKNKFFKGSSKLIEVEWKNKQNIWNCYHIREIILTTDPDLIKDGVQAIDDTFLEWFVKNPSCEEVETIYEPKNYLDTKRGWEYVIIIPKEEPNPFELQKTLPDDVFYESLESKQETLEEATYRLSAEKFEPKHIAFMLGVIEGAKWQQEIRYGEEESFENKSLKWWMSLTMDEQVEIGFKYDMPTFNLTLRAIMHEFEQFKKK